MPQGTTTINFGAFPGKTDAFVIITGQASILAGSLVEAWVLPADTADHSADEHWVDKPVITACAVVAGVGFSIFALAQTNRLYGVWNVAWVWN